MLLFGHTIYLNNAKAFSELQSSKIPDNDTIADPQMDAVPVRREQGGF